MKTKHDDELISRLNFEDVLLDSLPNPVYYKDVDGKFIRCNSCFASLVKSSKENIIGKLAYEFFPKDVADRHRQIDKNIMKTFGTFLDEVMLNMQDGSIKYFTLNKAVYLNSDGSVGGIVCVMNDITNRVKEKEFLIQQSKFAEMGEMIASIAHQWSEPLVELSAQVQKMELLYSLKKIDQGNMHDFVQDMMVQIQYMSDTLSDFRNFLKPSTVKKSFKIKKALDDIFEIVGKQIFYFNIKVNFTYEDEKTLIYGFENELKQVLLNIINNAKNKMIKIDKKEKFSGLININIYSDKKFNFIEISDNGGAINDEVKSQVFEPFFTTKSGGTGFGLYMAKVIVEDKMDGKITVHNDVDDVVFTIKIPKKNDDLL